MAQIIPKLDLNKTPQHVESNSLIFAKNIKLNKDGTITKDEGLSKVLDISELSDIEGLEIVGTISYNSGFYVFISDGDTHNYIYYYDEKGENKFIKSAWKWSRGEITGNVVTNLRGDILLTVCEYNAKKIVSNGDDVEIVPIDVPIKTINITKSTNNDDESIYTPCPNVPFIHLNFINYCFSIIPNGIYVFYVRFNIYDEYYTPWYPCSKELFAGTKENIDYTSVGSLSFVKETRDSTYSFSFEVETLYTDVYYKYKKFQLGFTCNTQAGSSSYIWKEFDINTKIIDFIYNDTEGEKVDNTEFTNISFNLYNIHNIVNFKNKQYISNYKETDLNEQELQSLANNIHIDLNFIENITTEGDDVPEHIKSISGVEIDDITYSLINSTNGVINGVTTALKDYNTFDDSLLNILFNNNPNNFGSGWKTKEDRTGIKATTKGIGRYRSIDSRLTNGTVGGATKGLVKQVLNLTDGQYNDIENKIIQAYNNAGHQMKPFEFNISFIRGNDSTNYINDQLGITGNDWQILRFDLDYNIGNREEQYLKFLNYINTEEQDKFEIGYDIDNTLVFSNFSSYEIALCFPQQYSESGQYAGMYWTMILFTITFVETENFIINNNDSIPKLGNTISLLPFQSYRFFVHFIKRSGEITNGYPIKNLQQTFDETTWYYTPGGTFCEITTAVDNNLYDTYDFGYYPNKNYIIFNNLDESESDVKYKLTNHVVIYPKFSNIVLNDEYIGCFFTYYHKKDKIIEINPRKHYTLNESFGESIKNENYMLFDSIELDSMLETFKEFYAIIIYKDEVIYTKDVDILFKYYVGTNPSNLKTFGNSGLLVAEKDGDTTVIFDYLFTTTTNQQNENTYTYRNPIIYLQVDYNVNEEDVILRQCTPYIFTEEYDNNNNLNIGGYIAEVIKPEIKPGRYISSGTLYDISLEGSDANRLIKVDESEDVYKYYSTKINFVYSNYNLNYISANYDSLRTTIKGITEDSVTNNYLTTYIESSELSTFYKYLSYYKNINRKIYSKVEFDKYITIFDNTIRSSKPIGDEDIIYNFKYTSGDYYNVPTDKGKIVNMIAVGNEILVHTNDSIYRFSGDNTLTTKGGEDVTTIETDVIDTGIKEVFGSDKGFAGLQNKLFTLITQGNYWFYDDDSRMIYNYQGNGNISVISNNIERLLNEKIIKDVRFANDYYNSRIFIRITFDNGDDPDTAITLSYNFAIKSFISLHDFNFFKAINTKVNCYFEDFAHKCIYAFNKATSDYSNLMFVDNDYPTFKIVENDTDCDTCVIDVVFNQSYERVKILDSIAWVCSKIQQYYNGEDNVNIDSTFIINNSLIINDAQNTLNTFVAEEHLDRNYSGNKLMLYTDSTYSGVLDISERSNDKSITRDDFYTKPRYNLGQWFLNYFKDIKNITNVNEDEHSELYGKYIVARFIFKRNENFKLENVTFNCR